MMIPIVVFFSCVEFDFFFFFIFLNKYILFPFRFIRKTTERHFKLWTSPQQKIKLEQIFNQVYDDGYRLRPSTHAHVFVDGGGDGSSSSSSSSGGSGGGGGGGGDPNGSSSSSSSSDDLKSRDLHIKGKIQIPLTSSLERHGVQAYGDLSKIASNHAGYNIQRSVVQSALREIAVKKIFFFFPFFFDFLFVSQ